MCFSSGASFGAAAILGAAGIASISRVKKISELTFASIPLIFGVQQFMEGMIWTEIHRNHLPQYEGIYGILFLITARIIWPVWVPFSIMLVEERKIQRRILIAFGIIGIIAAAHLGSCIFNGQYIATIRQSHLHYDIPGDHKEHFIFSLFYLISTILPAFVSSRSRMNSLGLGILMSAVVSKLYFEEEFASVWCYLAAVLSACVFWIIIGKGGESERKNPKIRSFFIKTFAR